jgi:hypothetical protein
MRKICSDNRDHFILSSAGRAVINKASHYTMALWIALLVTLTELVIFLYVAFINFERALQASAIRVLIPLALLLGIWLQSNIARYLGAIWLLISAGFVIWPLFSSTAGDWRWVLWAFVLVALSLVLAYILVGSKKFAEEFASLREKQPQYKKALKRLLAIVLIAAAAFIIYNDILHLAARWTAWRTSP